MWVPVLMLPWKSNLLRYYKLESALESLHLPMYGTIIAIINTCIYLIFKLPNYSAVILFISLVFFVINGPNFIDKNEKKIALFWFYLGGIIAMPGITLISINLNLTLIYLFVITFALYALTLKNTAYLTHASLCVTFAILQINNTNIPGSIHEAFNLWAALNLAFFIILVITMLYPERYEIKYRLLLEACLLSFFDALTVKDKKSFHLSLEQISYNLSQIDKFLSVTPNQQYLDFLNLIRPATLTVIFIRTIHFNDGCLEKFYQSLKENKFISDKELITSNLLLTEARIRLKQQLSKLNRYLEKTDD